VNTQEGLDINDTLEAALAADITALGGVKKVAKPILWPAKDEITAQSRLRAALAPNHAQELSLEEMQLIIERAARVGSFNTISFLCGKARGQFQRVEPRTRVELLMEQVHALNSTFTHTVAELQTAIADLRDTDEAQDNLRRMR
jgi:hypothetical protein